MLMYRFSTTGFAASAHLNTIFVQLREFKSGAQLKLTKMSEDEVKLAQHVHKIQEWTTSEDLKSMKKSFQFEDFVQCFSFINSIGLVCDNIRHYPRISNVYNKVEIELQTIPTKSLTLKDFILAYSIDSLKNQISQTKANNLQDVSYVNEKEIIERWNNDYEKTSDIAENL